MFNYQAIKSTNRPVQFQPTALQSNQSAAPSAHQQQVLTQLSPNTAKIKCKKYVTTMIKMLKDGQDYQIKFINNIIQKLIVSKHSNGQT